MQPLGYTTKTEIENYLLIDIDSSFDAQVDRWIMEVEKYINQRTGRVFVADAEASDRYYDGDRTGNLLIDDCIEVESVTIGTGSALAPTGYLMYPANTLPKKSIQLRCACFPWGQQNVKVSAKWGYSAEAPMDIRSVATVLVAGIINYAWNSEGEVQSETIGRYSVSYKTQKNWQDFEQVDEILGVYENRRQ